MPRKFDFTTAFIRNCFICTFFILVRTVFGQRSASTGFSFSSTRASVSCSEDFYDCGNRCIPSSWLCDGDIDCDDGSDENRPECSRIVCTDEQFKCVTPPKCIPLTFLCDSEDDCADGADEKAEHCNVTKCYNGQFQCPANKACIPTSWLCDGHNDCGDNADERNCTSQGICKSNEFQCNNGRCIFQRWKCDHDDDCGDASDESPTNCTYTCPTKHFQCTGKDRRCIPERWRCDGEADCQDHSDELNCNFTSIKLCRQDEYQCNDAYCIHDSWRCDGDFDCPDQSDEANCNVTCTITQFACENPPACVPSGSHCNGIRDCADGSDEKDCPSLNGLSRNKCDIINQFDCGDKFCIPTSQVCDGVAQCPGRQPRDEPPYVNCTTKDVDFCVGFDKCSQDQICRNTWNGAFCECVPGFRLDLNNQYNCIDINECEIDGWCSQLCANTRGGFHCVCYHGYVLAKDKRTCYADGDRPSLWLSNKARIREIDIRTMERKHLLEDLHSAVAMDFHYKKNIVVWSDMKKGQILLCQLKNDSAITRASDCQKAIVPGNVSFSDGLAVDWIHELLYWTDTGYNTISVVSLDGQYRKTLFQSMLDEPRAIALDPRKGVMFWSDWGQRAKIERAGMDGTQRSLVVQDERFVAWPNGLAVDLVLERLYWADAKHKHIMSVDYDGRNMKTVLNSWSTLKHPFSITVFENHVFWTDWETEGIHYANKFDGSNATQLVAGLFGPMTVRVHHVMSQPSHANDNKCVRHKCMHLCAPTLHSSKNGVPFKPFTCLCADGFDMHRDGFTCINSDNDQSDRMQISLPVEPVQANQLLSLTVGLLCLIAVLGLVLGYFLYKRYDNRNKRLNFENPIYRRSSNNVDADGQYDHLHLALDSSSADHVMIENIAPTHRATTSSSSGPFPTVSTSRAFSPPGGGSGVYQPTIVTVENYAIARCSGLDGKNSMKLPLTEYMYDENE